MSEYLDLLPHLVKFANAELPEGFDTWGIKSTRPDLTTKNGFQWPLPGGIATASRVNESNTGACPSRDGDGLCVATTWQGMASGRFPARTLLLVATKSDDVLGSSAGEGKTRHREVAVVALLDGEKFLREYLRGANLCGADLRGANLRGADLYGANLRGANLGGADLYGADLYGANLRGANLGGADLRGADLYGANLRGANLGGADLRGANLCGADLRGADLYGANLRGANLCGADLRGANLGGADLGGYIIRSSVLTDEDRAMIRARGEVLL